MNPLCIVPDETHSFVASWAGVVERIWHEEEDGDMETEFFAANVLAVDVFFVRVCVCACMRDIRCVMSPPIYVAAIASRCFRY